MPCTIHGWRPLSVTTQPAITATKPSHQVCATIRRYQRVVEQLPAPPQQRAEQRRRDHEEADADHDAEGEEHRDDRRPVRRRHVFRPGNSPFGSCVRMSEEPRGIEIAKRLRLGLLVRPGEDVEVAGLRCRPSAPPWRRS